MVSAGKVFTNEKGRIISLIFDIFLRLVYASEKKSTFFTWFCRSVVLQLRRGDFVEDKGEIKMAVLAKHVNLSFEVAQNKSQQFIAHSNNKQALNSILERQKKHSASVAINDRTQRTTKNDIR